MGTEVVKVEDEQQQVFESALIKGDLSKLTTEQKLNHYLALCKSLGLNPLTKPFQYVILNGKLILYASKDATDQLRKNNKVSIRIRSRAEKDGVYTVVAQAVDYSGRTDEASGSVEIEGKKGKDRANAMMIAESKAKRRVTLSIVGLGVLDETEIETVRGAKQVSWADAVQDNEGQTAEKQVVDQLIILAAEKGFEVDQIKAWAKVDDLYVLTEGQANMLQKMIELRSIEEKN